jgi:hypothetical protein
MNTRSTRRLTALGVGAVIAVPLTVASMSPASAAVPTETAAMLQAMVVEEKLAHDIYVTLGDLYSVRRFDAIARSESRHQSAVRRVMDAHAVVDPTAGDPVGAFDDPDVQKMYDDLVAQGSASLAAAAQVGIAIETMDIADLDEALAADQPADVTRVLSRLRAGSENHLAAFTRLADGRVDPASRPAGGSSGDMGHHGGRAVGRVDR